MIKEPIRDRAVPSPDRPSARKDDRRADLIRALSSLLETLKDRPRDASGGGEAALEQWEDEAYYYMEVQLAGRAFPEVDVSVFGRRAYIRLERRGARSDS